MLREEQIDIRRERARTSKFHIENLGKKRVFSDYQVTNPDSGGQYRVAIRSFEVGENHCTCPDFRANTLGTCKHIEAVLDRLRGEIPPHLQQRRPTFTRPEVYLRYGEQLTLGIHLPPRHSDKLRDLATRFFDPHCLWKGTEGYDELIHAIESVPEEVTVLSDAMDFMDWEIERREMATRESEMVVQLEAGTLELGLLKVPLYSYQIRGALFAAYRGRAVLGDDMGLGKTVQTLAAVELLARERAIERVLVIAPASVKYQWEGEIRKFTDRAVQVIEGGPRARKRQYAESTFYRLANYEQVVRDRDAFNDWRPDYIVLDEAQRIKNWESKTSRAVKKLRSRYALVLTGTPLENRLEELYSIVQFVDDRRLGPAFQFLHEHRVVDEHGHLLGYRNLDKIRERLAPIFLRRTRAEVLSQLPPRTDNTVYVELAEEQRLPYEEQRATLARLLQKSYQTELDRKRILACLVNLRMICDSTFLFDKQTNVAPKLGELTELISELCPPLDVPEVEVPGHKVVVFSQWETMLVKAAEVLERLGVGYAMLHGGLTGPERRAVLERFRDARDCRVFLSTDAGGTGLNLQMADTVINLEVPWNPAVLDQRIARVHRMGQERPVRVVNLVTRNSIEEQVLKTIALKRELFASVFDGETDEVHFTALGQEAFLDTIRELIGQETRLRPGEAGARPTEDPARRMWVAGIDLLEALAAMLQDQDRPSLPPGAAQRGMTAIQRLLDNLEGADSDR